MTAHPLFPNRRSRYVFVLRIAALVVMIGAVGLYGLAQVGNSRATPTPPAPSSRSESTPVSISLSARPTPSPAAALSTGLSEPTATIQALPMESVASATSTSVPETPGALDAAGIPSHDVVLVSDDGLARLTLPRGTRLHDSFGAPLDSITVTSKDPQLLEIIALVGKTYEFAPAGATLDPPGALTIDYNPNAIYPFGYVDVDCSQMHMAYYLGNKSAVPWAVPWLPTTIDFDKHTATTTLDHLGDIILFCQVFTAPRS